MKNLFYYLLTGFLMIGLSSCGDDLIDDNATAPSIDFTTNPGVGFITGNTSANAGVNLKVKITGTKGTDLLRVLTLTSQKSGESEINVPITNLVKDGQAASSNPILIPSSDQSGFTYTFEWPNSLEMGDVTYTFYLEDVNGRKDDVSFRVTTLGRGLSLITAKLLTNSASPAGRGGIDLYTGKEYGSTNDTSILSANGNLPNLDWSQEFMATNPNNTVIRSAKAGLDFSSLSTTIDLENAYNEGTVLTGFIKGTIGAIYLVNKNNYIWAVTITDIVLTPPLPSGGDNLDHFVLDIKQ
ncbi:MAG: hypothetical protein IPH93_01615 [Saprospiraceae bacterium]|nr:hypothetical protein [Saprospiraceae bacterium]MBK7810201.1 hypothetical protein [Saprospiraceae bacterium]MBK9629805.1 hypothetical protein [Saprospiraceae bacterium]